MSEAVYTIVQSSFISTDLLFRQELGIYITSAGFLTRGH